MRRATAKLCQPGVLCDLLRSQITPAASTVEQIAQRVIHVDAAIKHSP
jgi:hypothetical protein